MKLPYLKKCPFCGGDPEMVQIGNDHTKSRSIVIKCNTCRIQRKDSAIRYNINLLEKVAVDHWNNRTTGE